MVYQFASPGSILSFLLPADQPWRGGGSSLSAALHLQTGDERRRGQSGETLELLRLPGHQEHIRLGLSVHATGTRRRTDGRLRPHGGARWRRDTQTQKPATIKDGTIFLPDHTRTRMSRELFRVFVSLAETYLRKRMRRKKKTAASLWLQEC